MILDLKKLPSDTKILHQMIGDLSSKVTDLLTENTSLLTENTSLLTENTSLRDQLALLKAKRFGKSSEKLDKQISDLELKIEESESNLTQDTAKAKRKPLPEHLPREDRVLNPDPICPSCGTNEFRKISDDISESLDYVPSSFKVIRTIRPRCACINCEAIVQAYPADKAISKGNAEAGLLAHILVQKYCNHLPYYRQSEIYEREGVMISRSTMAGWAGSCSRLLIDLVVSELKKSVFNSKHIHGDDTVIKVLAPGLGKTKTGRIWTYVRDGRSYGDDTPPAICYFYSPDRKAIRPAEHLADYSGVFHADAYPGYDKLYSSGDITEAACWAHTRRKFYEITVANDKANIAIEILTKISEIYQIEETIKGQPPNQRLAQRQEQSKPLLDNLFKRLKEVQKKLPRKSSTARAIYYALANEEALSIFLSDGKIEIDNNAAERAMRSIAIGRKNWLFAGSDKGGDVAANIYSIIATCKINNINPQKYLHKLLSVIAGYNHKKIEDLLPWNLKLD